MVKHPLFYDCFSNKSLPSRLDSVFAKLPACDGIIILTYAVMLVNTSNCVILMKLLQF